VGPGVAIERRLTGSSLRARNKERGRGQGYPQTKKAKASRCRKSLAREKDIKKNEERNDGKGVGILIARLRGGD